MSESKSRESASWQEVVKTGVIIFGVLAGLDITYNHLLKLSEQAIETCAPRAVDAVNLFGIACQMVNIP